MFLRAKTLFHARGEASLYFSVKCGTDFHLRSCAQLLRETDFHISRAKLYFTQKFRFAKLLR
ncbi:MAG: hypothetical protein DRR16_08840, partial [Candidatus Parabeggiatoa sp. nov. 3]